MNNLKLKYRSPKKREQIELAEIRARAMKDSLMHAGRFDEIKVRKRLIDSYDEKNTVVVEYQNIIIGYYTLIENENEFYLHHFYIDLPHQGKGFGKMIMDQIKEKYNQKVIKLNALKFRIKQAFFCKFRKKVQLVSIVK